LTSTGFYHAVSHALRPFNAAIHRVKEFGIDKMFFDRPHAMMRLLFKTYALSPGMYASQIWSMQFLEHENVFSNLPCAWCGSAVLRGEGANSLRAPTSRFTMHTI